MERKYFSYGSGIESTIEQAIMEKTSDYYYSGRGQLEALQYEIGKLREVVSFLCYQLSDKEKDILMEGLGYYSK